jgi:hypothetical protein
MRTFIFKMHAGAIAGLLLASCASANVLESTLTDQTDAAVTVYNQNMALVKDSRKIELPKGTGELRFMDVASQIDPVTVKVNALGQAGEFSVLEQNYEYDLLSPSKLLDKYVGQDIRLIAWNEFQDRKEVFDAKLLSNNESPIYQIGDSIYLGHPGIQVLPELPENLIAKPTLTWLYDYQGSKPLAIEVSYLTLGMSWKADYVLSLDASDSLGDLSGWVSVDNRSGATYTDAKLKLVAGDVNRVESVMEKTNLYAMARMASDASQFQEESFFEYHLYDLERRTTLKDNQTKQISLLEAKAIAVQKRYVVRPGPRHFYYQAYAVNDYKVPVAVDLEFNNSSKNNLGMPLPAGIVRLYKKDASGSLQFVGEDRLDHTPKDESIPLHVGKAFDVVAERRQTDYRRVTTQMHETAWEIKLRNHKDETVEVIIQESLEPGWKILDSSAEYVQVDAFHIEYKTEVPQHGEAVIRYRVQVGI